MMWITTWTKAEELLPYMGTEATVEEAKFMRDILIQSGHCNIDTAQIPENEWLEMCETAVRFAFENPGHWDRSPAPAP